MKFDSYWLKVLSVFGFLILLICIWITGGGHGYIQPLMFFFPWGMVGVFANERMMHLFILLGLIQYPAYGVIIGFRSRIKNFNAIFATIIFIHVIMGILIMMYW